MEPPHTPPSFHLTKGHTARIGDLGDPRTGLIGESGLATTTKKVGNFRELS